MLLCLYENIQINYPAFEEKPIKTFKIAVM